MDLYVPSKKAFPEQLPEVSYPDDFDVRKIRYGGWVRCHGPDVYASRQLVGEYVGLKRINEDLYEIYFAQMKLGIVDRRLGRIIRPDRGKV